MSNFSIDGRMKGLPDIQKNYMFEVWIPSEGFNSFTREGLIIRAKTAVIPGRDFEQIETFFMGTKQLFPGKATFSNALQVTFDEFEDQTVTKALYEWQQKIFDYNPNSGTAGAQRPLPQAPRHPVRRSITGIRSATCSGTNRHPAPKRGRI